MVSAINLQILRRSLGQLADLGVIPQVYATLVQQADQVAAVLREAVLAEIPAFSASANPQILPGLATHGCEHVAEICRLIAEGTLGDFDFVVTTQGKGRNSAFPSKYRFTLTAVAIACCRNGCAVR